jgi:hypothetical protein
VSTDVEQDAPELSLWRAVRAAASAMSDDFVRFVAGNVAWLAVVGAALLTGRLFLPGHALLVLIVPASYGLCRMTAFAVRGRPARLAQFRAGVTRRGWAGFGLGCLQLVLLALAATNVTIAVQAPSLPLVLSAAVSAYSGLFLSATVLAVWPLLLDPAREQMAMRSIVRLGLVVIAARPGRQLALVILEGVLVAVGLQAFVAALLLPAFGLLVSSWVVLPLADELATNSGSPADPRTIKRSGGSGRAR